MFLSQHRRFAGGDEDYEIFTATKPFVVTFETEVFNTESDITAK